ncbi:Golgin subfamily A member 3 [Bagarius yarrelli]|uniref:Golgin subfamily A member 3 n=1 Tax=Bagarius yarrelli TaxID=175774 RepID=A0A556UFX7_BAGYA|nr:Golgin subfamily A member 3 [Bagarius yarrelli]
MEHGNADPASAHVITARAEGHMSTPKPGEKLQENIPNGQSSERECVLGEGESVLGEGESFESVEPSLEMENEEKIRLEARRRLEEQLKQYRVQRHKERSRLCSTLDPELMLHPDILPRASAVAMTTEYSFLRTSVPRGPKLGSLGIPAPKEKKSKSLRSGKIHSLADYKTPETSTDRPGVSVSAVSETNTSSVSTLSEISTSSVSTLSETSVLSSESGGDVELAASRATSQREEEEMIVGRYPSLREVLQAANEELELEKESAANEELESESGAESRSRRDSFSSTVSYGSSVMGAHDELLQVLKEKMRLEGQLESLTSEASQALKEKTELQAELAALNTRLRAQCEETRLSSERQASLASEVSSLRSERGGLERAMTELQDQLEEKNAGMESLSKDLQLAEQQYQRLMGRVEDMQQSLSSRDITVGDLRQQLTGLHAQLQQVEAERAALNSRLQTSQAEAGHMTQIGVLENLKIENVNLSHQLTETKHRSIKEKERIAVQLQSIEADMLTQEAAIQQIQDAKSMVENDLQQKLEELEEEREQLLRAASKSTALERELEEVRVSLSQKEAQLSAFQREHVDLMKTLTETQDALQSKEREMQLIEARFEQLQAELDELQANSSTREEELQFLRNEKIVLEVALQAVHAQKNQLGDGAEKLGQEVMDSSDALEQLRQEVQVQATQIESLQQENISLKKQAQKLKEQFNQQKVMVEAYRRDAASKEQLISELKATKKRLLSEVKELKEEVQQAEQGKKSAELEQQRLLQEVQKNQLSAVTQENEVLRKKVEEMQSEAKKAISEQKVRMKRLGTDLTSAQKELKVKHKAYENAVSILSRRLQEALVEKETAEAELVKLQAQVDKGGNNQALEAKVESLQAELNVVLQSKAMLERELQEVISLTSNELEEYQEKVLELEDELQESRGFKKRIRRLEDANKKLALELEHEKGKLTGLGQSHNALREHTNVLETALAKREADLVQLNLQVQAVLKRKEEEDQQMKNLVQTLQAALEKEKIKVKELTEQARLEAAHNRRHYRAAVLELSEIRKELQAKEELLRTLQDEARRLEAQDAQRSQDVSRFESELAEARTQLQILQKQLDDELNKQPLTNQEQRVEVKCDSAPLTPVKIPDCPVPASLLDELLKPAASVNKEPLNNLHNCLRQLKEEMDSLQKQMEEHTVTVATWVTTEEELQKLGIHDNGSSPNKEGLEEMPSA